MRFFKKHVCDKMPKGCLCSVSDGRAVIDVNVGNDVLTRGGLCRFIDVAVNFDAEFCPWCGKRIEEVAE